MTAPYLTDEHHGDGFDLWLGDSCERMPEIPDDSVDFTICSPPFASLFTYSDSERDLGNSRDRAQFLQHYAFIIREQLRILKPGRVAAIHVQQIATRKNVDGYIGITDFRGDVIRAFESEGWWFAREITIDKNPQAQAIRTKAHNLMFATKNRDSAYSMPALADYLLLFRKPGENDVPINQTDDHWTRVSNDEWIKLAHPIWYHVEEGNTLNTAIAKEDADERHIAPLQLGLIADAIRLWSNPGELVFTPFLGIGSEVHEAIRLERRGLGIELKPSYWSTAVTNCERAAGLKDQVSVLDVLDA